MSSLKYKTNNGYEPLPAMVVRKTNAENGNGIGTCSTSSGTALTVSLTGYELVQNGFVAVTFEHDVPANATLNVNGKGAKPIYYKGSAITADTIKADDTALFSYDGTNYVLISSGGSGSIPQEELTISLASNQTADTGLNGATVTVTATGVVEPLYSGTWAGTNIVISIDAGIEYTVTVGSVTGYATPATQTFVAIGNNSRTATFTYNTTIVTVSAITNQSSHADVSNVQMTVAYGQVSESVANGSTIKIPTGSEATITFPSVTGYATPSTISLTASGTAMSESGTYNTEVVTVTCTTEDSVAVTGHKVTINNVEYTLDSTGIVSAKVAYGTAYTVSLGSWSGYLTQSQSFTAGQASRAVSMQWETMYVDLGLPSGTKWAKRNIDATQADGFTVSTYQYECSLFSWANIVGHNPVNDQSDYMFSDSDYTNTTGSNLQADIPDGSTTYDAARVHCGSPWKMPTKTQAEELFSNTDIVDLNDNIISSGNFAVQISGVYGYLFKSKINSKKIFFPLAGYIKDRNTVMEKGLRGRYWFSTIYAYSSSDEAWSANFIINSKDYLTYDYYRPSGMPIRPVQ